jgi:AcrR family transcriptional regulator
MVTKSREGSARERLLSAANELFYKEGIHTGIDRVIEHAGVAKASLYSAFGSKDELIRAYLEARHEARKQRYAERLPAMSTPRAKILGLFDLQAELVNDPGYRGCAFVNASTEAPSSKACNVTAQSRAWLRSLFEGLVRELGVKKPEALAAQLALLYDGATIGAQIDRDPTASATARAMAATLLDAASR